MLITVWFNRDGCRLAKINDVLTLSLLRVIHFKFPLQPQQKCFYLYYITQYDEPGFSLTKYDHTTNSHYFTYFSLKCWENVLSELRSKRVKINDFRIQRCCCKSEERACGHACKAGLCTGKGDMIKIGEPYNNNNNIVPFLTWYSCP